MTALNIARPAQTIALAVEHAARAYQFNPGSYTFSALTACQRAAFELRGHEVPKEPDWIEEFTCYRGAMESQPG
jgi:hypothetical protein